MLRVTAVGLAASAGLGVAACGSSAPTGNPVTILARARAAIDAAPSLHFTLSSTGASGGGTLITGGEGDIARPDQLRGRFSIDVSGLAVTLQVLAGSGRFYVEAPFQTSFVATDPATYGVGNPAQLIDPVHGLSSLLPAVTRPRLLGQVRIGGEVVDQVTGTVPGARIPVLPDHDPSVPVAITVAVAAGSHQVRRVTLVGPFTSSAPSTYTVGLTAYGEPLHVTLPGG